MEFHFTLKPFSMAYCHTNANHIHTPIQSYAFGAFKNTEWQLLLFSASFIYHQPKYAWNTWPNVKVRSKSTLKLIAIVCTQSNGRNGMVWNTTTATNKFRMVTQIEGWKKKVRLYRWYPVRSQFVLVRISASIHCRKLHKMRFVTVKFHSWRKIYTYILYWNSCNLCEPFVINETETEITEEKKSKRIVSMHKPLHWLPCKYAFCMNAT